MNAATWHFDICVVCCILLVNGFKSPQKYLVSPYLLLLAGRLNANSSVQLFSNGI
jgi:hypothetical protein